MTAPDLSAIRAQLAGITPGPWIEYHENGTPGQLEAFNCPPATGAFLIAYADRDQQQKDANFIAAAPSTVERLLGIVDRLEDLATYLETLADGDRHYAALIREAIAGEGT